MGTMPLDTVYLQYCVFQIAQRIITSVLWGCVSWDGTGVTANSTVQMVPTNYSVVTSYFFI